MERKVRFSNKYTHEDLTKRFDSSFELVNYAIDRARSFIHSGRPPLVDSYIQNPAFIVLEEISYGKDNLESILPSEGSSVE